MRRAAAWVVGALLAGAPGAAAAYCRTTTSAAQPDPTVCPATGVAIAWQSGCTAIADNPAVVAPGIAATALHAILLESAQAWQSVACDPATRAAPSFELLVAPSTAAQVGYFDDRPNQNVVTFRATWGDTAFHDPNAAAITVVTFGQRTGVILDADTELNVQARYRFSLEGTADTTDLRTVVVHELGHTQGLAHSPDRAAVMWYTAGRGERRRVPNPDDVAGLCAIYPPTRPARCDPDARVDTAQGGGVSCASSPGRVSYAPLAAALAALAARRRRAAALR